MCFSVSDISQQKFLETLPRKKTSFYNIGRHTERKTEMEGDTVGSLEAGVRKVEKPPGTASSRRESEAKLPRMLWALHSPSHLYTLDQPQYNCTESFF